MDTSPESAFEGIEAGRFDELAAEREVDDDARFRPGIGADGEIGDAVPVEIGAGDENTPSEVIEGLYSLASRNVTCPAA